MTSKADADWHRKMAAHLFNSTWTLIEKKRRTKEERDTMIHMAHASRYHWGVVGGPKELAIGEWQISHVYAVVGRPEPSLFHAQRCLEICEAHKIGDFPLAYAYEALASTRQGPRRRRSRTRCRAPRPGSRARVVADCSSIAAQRPEFRSRPRSDSPARAGSPRRSPRPRPRRRPLARGFAATHPSRPPPPVRTRLARAGSPSLPPGVASGAGSACGTASSPGLPGRSREDASRPSPAPWRRRPRTSSLCRRRRAPRRARLEKAMVPKKGSAEKLDRKS